MPALRDLIIKAQDVVSHINIPIVVKTYPLLMTAVAQKEFTDEVGHLEKLSQIENDDARKKKFTTLCETRAKRNSVTALHFATAASSECNKLYFNIAKVLYPEASFYQLFMMLLPEVATQWRATIVIGNTELGKKFHLFHFLIKKLRMLII